MEFVKKAYTILASFGLACVLFLFMLLLVFLGTIEQLDQGLLVVQEKYFSSFFLVHDFFGVVPVPLPGGLLLMILLSINLICGGFIRIKKDRKRIGVMIIHFGILFLLFGGLVQRVYATDGHLTLYEGDQSNQYESYYLWEIAIAEANLPGEVTQYSIPNENIIDLAADEQRTFVSSNLPFDLTLSHYMTNCQPMPKGPMFNVDVPVIDGMFLQRAKTELEAEKNIAGCYVTIRDKDTGQQQTGILWGRSWWLRDVVPWTVQSGGKTWAIDLRKQTYPIPFMVHLDKFTHTLHPGTDTPASFSSDVTKIQNGMDQRLTISMNAPLRSEGYTLYQASWGPSDAKPGQRLFSSLAVWWNPVDKFPLYACVIISIGLVLHFSSKLFRYLRAESKRAAGAA